MEEEETDEMEVAEEENEKREEKEKTKEDGCNLVELSLYKRETLER